MNRRYVMKHKSMTPLATDMLVESYQESYVETQSNPEPDLRCAKLCECLLFRENYNHVSTRHNTQSRVTRLTLRYPNCCIQTASNCCIQSASIVVLKLCECSTCKGTRSTTVICIAGCSPPDQHGPVHLAGYLRA